MRCASEFVVWPRAQIAKSMVLYVGTMEAGAMTAAAAKWRRLGSLAFDANERSAFKARELKSVRVSTPAHLLRLAVQECHVNAMNTYKQARGHWAPEFLSVSLTPTHRQRSYAVKTAGDAALWARWQCPDNVPLVFCG